MSHAKQPALSRGLFHFQKYAKNSAMFGSQGSSGSLGSIAHRHMLSMPCIVQAGGTRDEFDRLNSCRHLYLHR